MIEEDESSDTDWDQVSRELASVLNRHSVDTALDTPDFILGDLLVGALQGYGKATTRTASWKTS